MQFEKKRSLNCLLGVTCGQGESLNSRFQLSLVAVVKSVVKMLQILENCIVLSKALNMPCLRTDETVENNRKNLLTCDQASVVNTTVVYKWRKSNHS